jgi:hypothetical protein
MQFVKDIGTEDGFSKFNHLARTVASVCTDTRFACHENPDVAVWQLGDGMAIVDRFFKRPVVIVHDWFPHYEQYIDLARKVIFLGNFDHPEYSRAIHLSSYPYDIEKRLPADDIDVLVEGVFDGSCTDWVLERCTGKRVRMVCFPNDDPEFEEAQAELERRLGEVTNYLEVRKRVYELVLASYIRSAPLTLHCGSGNRGFLHSMAVSYGGITKKCDDRYTVSTVADLVKVLR